MRSIKSMVGRRVVRRVAPVLCVALVGVAAAACGSSGSTSGGQNTPTSGKSGGVSY